MCLLLPAEKGFLRESTEEGVRVERDPAHDMRLDE
jgi:hypothetical protein